MIDLFPDIIFIKILNFLDYNKTYKLYTFLKNNLKYTNKHVTLFKYVLNKKIVFLNIHEDNSINYEYFYILNYFFKNNHLSILHKNKKFLKYLYDNSWAYFLYSHKFEKKYTNNKIMIDTTIKELIIDIMTKCYFVKILRLLENKMYKYYYKNYDKYIASDSSIGYKLLINDILYNTENIRNDLYQYLDLNYKQFKIKHHNIFNY